ncbi:MAG: CoA ester lyase [Bradyrhizobium sp.]|nr:CoA ester lyase [Bradyrhizobium sp.]
MSASDPRAFTARSLLFVPGDSPRKLEKALDSGADLLLLDLEDSVAEGMKPEARRLVAEALAAPDRKIPLWVRINPLDTPHALADLAAIVPAGPDGIMLPKAVREDADRLHHYLTALEAAAGLPHESIRMIVVATETAEALFRLGEYPGTPRLDALTWGAEDIATALGASGNRDASGEYEFPYQLARTLCLAGAVAAGVAPVETIDPDFRNGERLERVAGAMRRAGFRGMMAIHPAQVPIINRAFAPSEAEITRARRIVDLFAANPGAGTLGLDGEMVDVPHLKRAHVLLAIIRE